MRRRSQRISSGSAATSTHKRAASGALSPSENTSRTKKLKATPTKSQYFKNGAASGSGEGADENASDDDASSVGDDDASDFDDVKDLSPSESGADENDIDSESDEEPEKRKKVTSKSQTTTTAIRSREGDLWRPGVKTGLGPGTQVIIKKPKARPAGKTPYQDETIHLNTMLFLEDLKINNDRQWLKMHDADFRQAEKDWYSFVEKLTERLSEIDDTVPELPVKDVIFRIYRDVRFSKDPTPYKPHFSAAWSRTGRKGPYSHYYVQISPHGQSFVGGGLWHPEAAPVAAMRRDIDTHPRRLKDVLLDDALREQFLNGVAKKDAKAVKAFVSSNSENALKTRPKGYDAEHPDIDLLRLRNYTLGKKLGEAEVVGEGGLDRIAELLTCMKPFITYLNSVVMPDEDDADEGDGSEEDGEDESDGDEDEDEEEA